MSLRPLFEAAGGRLLELPVLYAADPFLETAGEDIRRRMFVTEGPSGERLALRPDFTIPVCLHHLASGAPSGRYFYEGLVFRRHDRGATERAETGFEVIGEGERSAVDAELVAMAVEGVRRTGLAEMRMRIGDIGLFTALLAALDLPPAWRQRLRRAFGAEAKMQALLSRLAAGEANGARPALPPELAEAAAAHDAAALAEKLAERFEAEGYQPYAGRGPEEIAARFLEQQALYEASVGPEKVRVLEAFLAMETAPQALGERLEEFRRAHGVDLSQAGARLARRLAKLQRRREGLDIVFSAGFGRPLDYYTGLVFDIRERASGRVAAGGGRYDRLLEMLGAEAPIPAAGFTIELGSSGQSAEAAR
ncbi:ATP phosphoribosyltransferase regulatory subunit [Afifella pfennigii]|uniref:ATP phosphoribosyltransferase regulatory subunit n=1 Tax=Afifella pfennigii TaxID=209897 RepID=UPI000479C046|nr:ATP phosphoribosyltransferase regulatory subunit [Afifella pfennigii]